MTVKLLAEHHLEFLSLKGGCTGLSESILIKMLHCWKSRHGSKGMHPTWVTEDDYAHAILNECIVSDVLLKVKINVSSYLSCQFHTVEDK